MVVEELPRLRGKRNAMPPSEATTLAEAISQLRMMAGGPMTWVRSREPRAGQYSWASITVITRTGTAGSVGSGEWAFKRRSR
jgi:hypothetical protein